LKTKTAIGTTFANPIKDPVIDYEHTRGRLLEQSIYTNTDMLVQKTVNVYSDTLDDSKAVRAVSVQNMTVTVPAANVAIPAVLIAETRAVAYLIHISPVFLLKTTNTNYLFQRSHYASNFGSIGCYRKQV
jgi:phage I-like protein